MSETRKGILAMIGACTVWGLSPLYYAMLDTVPPLEVLSHRTLWSALFFTLIIGVQGRLAELPRLLRTRRAVIVGLAALFISANWFLFIYSIQVGRAVQASLGYYIFPLVAVLLGVAAFGERLSAGQGAAVALAAAAVLLLTFGLGVTPWISLTLAATFGMYGLIKKRLDAGPVISVTAEVILLSPVAAVILWGYHAGWWGAGQGHFGHDLRLSALLAFSGLLTGGPLILFSYAARRVNMTTVGLIQYLNPTLQFLCATLIFREPFTGWHLGAFALIWTALAIYSAEALRQDRAARRAAASASRSGISAI